MKQSRIFALAACAICVFGLLGIFAACSSSPSQPQEGVKIPRVSAILPHNDYGYWTTVAEGIEEEAENHPLSVKIYLPQLNYNVDQMTELIHQQIAAQVDALIVQGIEDADYRAALEEAKAQGIEVLLIDTELPGFDASLYVGTDNYDAGVQMGQRLIEVTGGEAVVAVLSGAPGYPNLEQRLAGLRDAVAASPGIEICAVEYDEYDALTVMEKYHEIKREHPEVDTLVCIEGTGAQTLGQLEQEPAYDHILGFDYSDEGLEGLRSGVLDGLMVQQNRLMGQLCVRQIPLLRQKEDSEKVIYTEVRWITAEDLDEEGNYEGR